MRKLSRRQPDTQWGRQTAEPPGQGPEDCKAPSPTGQDLARAAAEIISGLHKAKEELAQELEVNLKQLHAVLEETQRIARQMKAVLSEIRGETEADQEGDDRSQSAADRRAAGQRGPARPGTGRDSGRQGHGRQGPGAAGARQEYALQGQGATEGRQNHGHPAQHGGGAQQARGRAGAQPEWGQRRRAAGARAGGAGTESEAPAPTDSPFPQEPSSGAEALEQQPDHWEPWEPPGFTPGVRDSWEPPLPWEPPEAEDPWTGEDDDDADDW